MCLRKTMSGRRRDGADRRRQQELQEIMDEVWEKRARTAWMRAEVEKIKWRVETYQANKWKLLWRDGICKHDAQAMDQVTDDGDFATLVERYEAGVLAGRWGCGCRDSMP